MATIHPIYSDDGHEQFCTLVLHSPQRWQHAGRRSSTYFRYVCNGPGWFLFHEWRLDSPHVCSGRHYPTIPLSQLDYPYRYPVVPFEIAAEGQYNKIIFRAVSTVGVEIPLTLTTISLLAESQQSMLVFNGALLVMFLFCFGITVILSSFTRDSIFVGVSLFFWSWHHRHANADWTRKNLVLARKYWRKH